MQYRKSLPVYPLLFILLAGHFLVGQTSSSGALGSHLSADQIIQRLQESDRQRSAALQEFQGMRFYHMEYDGFPAHHTADMVVKVTYRAPGSKEFQIVSQSGSSFIINHVFSRLLKDEQEGAREQNRQRIAINTANYDFRLEGFESSTGGPQYVLHMTPKKNSEFLLQGKIWVDAKDFAVTRIQGETSKTPSFWIRKNQIDHRYEKIDEFWLPAENHSESLLRLGGRAVLSIQYRHYRVVTPNLKAAIVPLD